MEIINTMVSMAVIQFIQGVNEDIVPDVRLTRSRDGSTGTATFRFSNPKVLERYHYWYVFD
jgi:photosystem II protein